jgi:ribonuclease P protein component
VKQHSLSRNERITGKKSFSIIFDRGIPVSVSLGSLRALYVTDSDPEAPAGVRMAVAISKRAGNAVWRNRLRRLIKESYRIQKQQLLSVCQQKGIALNVVFLPVGFNKKSRPKIGLQDIFPLVCELLTKLLEKV